MGTKKREVQLESSAAIQTSKRWTTEGPWFSVSIIMYNLWWILMAYRIIYIYIYIYTYIHRPYNINPYNILQIITIYTLYIYTTSMWWFSVPSVDAWAVPSLHVLQLLLHFALEAIAGVGHRLLHLAGHRLGPSSAHLSNNAGSWQHIWHWKSSENDREYHRISGKIIGNILA